MKKVKFFNYCMSFLLMTLVCNVAVAAGNDPVKPLPKVVKPVEGTVNISYIVDTEIFTDIYEGEKLVENPYQMPPIITRRQVDASFGPEGQMSFNMKFLTPESELYNRTKDWYEYDIPKSEGNNEGATEAKAGEILIKDGVLTVISTTGNVLQEEKLSDEVLLNYIGSNIQLNAECQAVYDMIAKAKKNGCEVTQGIDGKICITCDNKFAEGSGKTITVIDPNKGTIESAVDLDSKGNPKNVSVYDSECKDMKTVVRKIVQEVYKELGNGQTQITTTVSSFTNYTVN